jgi:hypothetical protein
VKRDSHLKIEKFGDSYSGIRLKGNPLQPETDHFGIKFPGGEIYVVRTKKGDYWAHVNVDRDERGTWQGEVVSERRDEYDHPKYGKQLYHLAVRVVSYLRGM